MVSSNFSRIHPLVPIFLVLALGGLVTSAPTPFSALNARSHEFSTPLSASITNLVRHVLSRVILLRLQQKSTIAEVDIAARSPVKPTTGYETYEAFMKESDSYHKITEDE
jgi:hypothetical protein